MATVISVTTGMSLRSHIIPWSRNPWTNFDYTWHGTFSDSPKGKFHPRTGHEVPEGE